MTRRGFSLLEIIIATAVLAASAMVLISLIGLGTKYGNRAEERTIALSQAESLIDEFLAQLGQTEKQDEQSGILAGLPQRSYRIIARHPSSSTTTRDPLVPAITAGRQATARQTAGCCE